MHRKQQQLRLELMEEDSDSFQHTCKAIRQQVTLANNCRQLQGTSLLIGHTACAFSCGNHVWQHAGGNTNPISVYDNDIRSKPICSGCTCPTTISTTVRTCCTRLTSYQLHNSQCPNIQFTHTNRRSTSRAIYNRHTNRCSTSRAIYNRHTNRRSTSRAIYNRRNQPPQHQQGHLQPA
ncbi:hypothetical protein NQZ68_017578 [Dissostichus eleginoides]|nr:hypothetical protein NQZ68_017578 [Dissostichus eleginoides]